MVSNCKRRQSNKRVLSQIDDSEQDIIVGNTASEKQENTIANEGRGDRDFTDPTSGKTLMTHEFAVNVKTLERCFNERIDRGMSNIVDTVEDIIQNAIWPLFLVLLLLESK